MIRLSLHRNHASYTQRLQHGPMYLESMANHKNQWVVIGLVLGGVGAAEQKGTERERKGWDGRGWGPLVWGAVSGGKQGTRQNGTEIEGRA